MHKIEWEQEDEEVSPTKRTAETILAVKNSIVPMLRFTMEIPEMFQNNSLPTLDTSLAIVGDRVVYKFFQKEMSHKVGIMASTALPANQISSTITAEVVRRLLTTSQETDIREKIEILDAYTQKLISGGHSRDQVRSCIIAGITKYSRMVQRSQLSSEDPCHRRLHDWKWGSLLENRKYKCFREKAWFIPDKNMEHEGASSSKRFKYKYEITSVCFVP